MYKVLFGLSAFAILTGCGAPEISQNRQGFENANIAVAEACYRESSGGSISGAEVTELVRIVGVTGAIVAGADPSVTGPLADRELDGAAVGNEKVRVGRQISGVYECFIGAANVTSNGAALWLYESMNGNAQFRRESALEIAPYISSRLRRKWQTLGLI